jgi:hypothetical protein
MQKRLLMTLGEALEDVNGRAATHHPTWAACVNAIAEALDNAGKDFRRFLAAAGADEEEQAKGKVG